MLSSTKFVAAPVSTFPMQPPVPPLASLAEAKVAEAAAAMPETYTLTPAPSPRGEKRKEPDATPPLMANYSEINVHSWFLKVWGKNSHNNANVFIVDAESRDPKNKAPVFEFFKQTDQRNYIPFRVETETLNGPAPSFLTGKPDPTKTESLDLQISVNEDQAVFLAKVDEWAKTVVQANAKEIFGREYSLSDVDGMYTPLLRRDKDDKFPPKLKGKMFLNGPADLLTQFHIISSSGTMTEGSGWKFVEEHLGPNKWRGHEAYAVLELRYLWVFPANRKCGIKVKFSHLQIADKSKPSARPSFPQLDVVASA
jgi:hypothetical protein